MSHRMFIYTMNKRYQNIPLHLTRKKTGSYRIKTTTTVSEYETDKWDPNEVGQYSGDIGFICCWGL